MGTFLVEIDGYDITQYVAAGREDFNPADSFSEPQFSGNALTDGDLFVAMTNKNREWTIPLIIIAASNDALAAEIRTINSHLENGVSLRYREEGATDVTYFDVEAARLDIEYRYQRNRQGVCRAVLKVWTRPYGHTGTTRVVRAGVATHALDIPVASLGLAGDAESLLRVQASCAVASAVATSTFNLLAWGYSPNPSHRTEWPGHGMTGNSNAGPHYIADGQSAYATVMAFVDKDNSNAYEIRLATTMPSCFWGQSLRLFLSMRTTLRASGQSFSPSAPETVAIARSAFGITPVPVNTPETKTGPWVEIIGASSPHVHPSVGVYKLYDLGMVTMPSLPPPGEPTRMLPYIQIQATNVATQLGTAPYLFEAAYVVPLGGAAVADPVVMGTSPYNSAFHGYWLMGVDAYSSGATALRAGGSIPTTTQTVVGDYPRVPAAAAGVLSVLAQRTTQRAAGIETRVTAVEIAAREQFQFLR